MVLEKLGESLKNTLSKIASAVYIDEKLVNELVKDMQRALLQSDVNVKLVLDLTQKIKKRVLEEEIPSALTKKEYLINVVYEELTNFLGGEGYKINIEKKPYKIMMVGLFGNGKCVHKDTNIVLSDGQTINVEKLYNIYKGKGEVRLKDGFIVPLNDEIYVPSFNPSTLKIEKKKVSHLWKLEGKDIVEVEFDNGNNFNIKTTPEHPFFVLDKGEIKQKRADEMKTADYVAIPTNYVSEPNYFEFLSRLDKLHYDISLRKDDIVIKHFKALQQITFPKRLTPKLSEFIGYVIGDGYLSKRSVNISSEDQEIIDRIVELSQKLFSKKPSITRDKRRKKLVNIRVNSYTLVDIIHNLFGIPIGKKGRKLEMPALIQKSDLEVIRSFIRAYFDCDAYFSPKQRQIELVSESKILTKQIHHVLLRFNILTVQIKKNVKGKEYYKLIIQAKHALRFAELIFSSIKRKQAAMQTYANITLKQGDGKQDMIPEICSLLLQLRKSAGYSINQIQKNVFSYGLYESKQFISKTQLQKVISFYERKEKTNIADVLGIIKDKEVHKVKETLSQGLFNALVGEFKRKDLIAEVVNSPKSFILTEKGENYFQRIKNGRDNVILNKLKVLAYSDLSWIKVRKVSKIENDSNFVYDLTVEDNHNFIADGIIVHNTTTASKIGKFFKKRGKKVALIQTDTWRPAAYDQLMQLGQKVQIDVFGNPKAKNPADIYQEFAPKLSKYDVIIVDTAGRDALNEELIEELNKINEAVNPDESLLVMSADVGQAAQRQAEVFNETCKVTGVIITKMDGTAKGGGALSACSVTNAPVKFIGVGEKVDDLEEFKPKNFVGRLLGMGDIETLLEKAKEAVTEEDAKDMSKKFLSGKFNLVDLYEQMSALNKMGPLGKVLDMVPGMGQLKLPKELISVQEDKLKKWKFIMDSCTKEELEDPDTIDSMRIERIAKGSGSSTNEVRELLKQYKQSRRVMKMFKGADSQKGMEKMMKKFKGGNIPGMGNVKLK